MSNALFTSIPKCVLNGGLTPEVLHSQLTSLEFLHTGLIAASENMARLRIEPKPSKCNFRVKSTLQLSYLTFNHSTWIISHITIVLISLFGLMVY
jgi:hypothetical protein